MISLNVNMIVNSTENIREAMTPHLHEGERLIFDVVGQFLFRESVKGFIDFAVEKWQKAIIGITPKRLLFFYAEDFESDLQGPFSIWHDRVHHLNLPEENVMVVNVKQAAFKFRDGQMWRRAKELPAIVEKFQSESQYKLTKPERDRLFAQDLERLQQIHAARRVRLDLLNNPVGDGDDQSRYKGPRDSIESKISSAFMLLFGIAFLLLIPLFRIHPGIETELPWYSRTLIILFSLFIVSSALSMPAIGILAWRPTSLNAFRFTYKVSFVILICLLGVGIQMYAANLYWTLPTVLALFTGVLLPIIGQASRLKTFIGIFLVLISALFTYLFAL